MDMDALSGLKLCTWTPEHHVPHRRRDPCRSQLAQAPGEKDQCDFGFGMSQGSYWCTETPLVVKAKERLKWDLNQLWDLQRLD